jgi:2-polyprenyl-3-methyl-5-hydroxy-6-metoxy-1,4-benzoquinol methylase
MAAATAQSLGCPAMPAPAVGFRRLLARAWVYDLLQLAVGSNVSHRRFIKEHVRLLPGERVLDIGCGPATILRTLPEGVDYVGIDESAKYIDAARRKWGHRGEFHRVDATARLPENDFDVVLVMGVLHHLDDVGCRRLLCLAAGSIKPQGRLVAIEPARQRNEAAAAAWLISRDRGAYVRDAQGYAALARPAFSAVVVRTRNDLLRIPYTHAVLVCRKPRPRSIEESR